MPKKGAKEKKKFEKIKKCIAEVLHISEKEITIEADLIHDLGADSLDVIDIQMRIEESFKKLKNPKKFEEELEIKPFQKNHLKIKELLNCI